MAQLKPNQNTGSGVNIKYEAPPGQYIAVCLKVIDLFGVMRKKYQSVEEAPRDVTRFVFGVLDQQNRPYLIQTFEFTMSSAPGANLIDFLKGWLGYEPQMGWDYVEMIGKGAMITVASVASKRNPSKTYAQITGISPVFPQLANQIPNPEWFAVQLADALKPQDNAPAAAPSRPATPQPQPGYAPQPAPAPAPHPGYAQQPHPAPAPAPHPQHAPAPAPGAHPGYAPAPVGHPAPQPAPAPAPVGYPQPQPGYAHPQPQPAPVGHPAPAPVGQPAPVGAPQPGYPAQPPPGYPPQAPAAHGPSDDDVPF